MVRKTDSNIVVLFDGVCNLCNGAVQFLIRRDRNNIFKFAALQSDPAHALLKGYRVKANQFDSIVIVKEGRVYERSDAVLILASALGFPWNLVIAGKVFPRWIRDGIYNFIARNRYRIFGRRESCMVPNAALKEKFLS